MLRFGVWGLGFRVWGFGFRVKVRVKIRVRVEVEVIHTRRYLPIPLLVSSVLRVHPGAWVGLYYT